MNYLAPQPVRIASLETAVPPHVIEQSYVSREAPRVFAHFRNLEQMRPVFTNAGIKRRYSVCPLDWFDEKQGWAGRTQEFLAGATALFRQVAGKALAAAGLEASAVDCIVTVSSTGIATPSIEAHVMHDIGFRDDVMRVPVFGLGCAGGLSGLAIASQLAAAPGRPTVLLVVIELCTLSFRADEMSKSNIVATALFGDGAAAAVLSANGKGPAIEHHGQHCWKDTIDIMGWRIDEQGFGAIFDRSIPDLVRDDLRPVADAFLARHGLSITDIDEFTFHPGGAKVVDALEHAFDLQQGQLRDERSVLENFGNMSAPTIMFVLKSALQKLHTGRRMLAALGPGFTATFMTMMS